MPIEPNASLMIRYLLRQLNERTRNEPEEAYVRDEATFETLCAAEDLLIDSYLRHKLRWRSRRRFEKYYLALPAHRQRMDDARKLTDAVSGDARDFSRRAGWPRLLVLTAAGVLPAVVMLIPWLLFLRERAEAGATKAKSLHVQPGRSASTGATVASVSLEPGIPKGSGTSIVRIELLLPRTPAYARYKDRMEARHSGRACSCRLLPAKEMPSCFWRRGRCLRKPNICWSWKVSGPDVLRILASYALAIQWR